MKTSKLLHMALTGTITLTCLFGFGSSSSASDNVNASVSNQDKFEQSAHGSKLIQTGQKYLGVKYKLGAEYEKNKKFDCSSFTQYIFKKNGIKIARGARAQYENGTPVEREDLKVGDLVFFATTKTKKYDKRSIKRIGHVGIYAGNDKVLHTYGKGGVKYDDFSDGWWDKAYVGAVRVKR
ncbi:C40 family peptidase [Ammoniphilus sp. 3BR4]|uniref:C40 family peptidase n=1 Tax=Ammoniphilus sp. 3BR4 TaxID=3158265 RepID=UPI0034657DA7